MKEIGGYIELDKFTGEMLYSDGIKLNCGRNALAYLIEAKDIKAIAIPKFMCDSCDSVLKKYDVLVRYYSIDMNFKFQDMNLKQDEWLYVVNYYGQLSNDFISELKDKYVNIIVDNSQAYFQEPIENVDTFYTCRKFFGVADGAILYTNKVLTRSILQDESYSRMNFLLGRFERSASEFYQEYVQNNKFFADEPIKTMSKLTENLLGGIDYVLVEKKRTENFTYLHDNLKEVNKLSISIPKGAFMYPLYIDRGEEIRKKLQEEKIYIPMLWPAVCNRCTSYEIEYDMAKNILPLPIDQRYSIQEMDIIIRKMKEWL